jgi:hypothetical protein
MKRLMVFSLLLLLLPCHLNAQQVTDSTTFWEISVRDGNTFSGFIILENSQEIVLKTITYGKITIPKVIITNKKILVKSKRKSAPPQKNTPIAEAGQLWRIVTLDGFDFVGTIEEETDVQIKLKTEKFGVVTLQRSNISNLQPLKEEELVGGDVWFENPQGARYFYSPNGYGLQKGEGYYQNVWVLFNQVSVGIIDYFTIGFGTVPTVLFGADVLPIWITPKFSYPIIENKLHIGAGIIGGGILGASEDEPNPFIGLTYGVITYGDKDKNINFGMGGFFTSNDGFSKYPVYSLSAMARASKKGYFLFESYVMTIDNETGGIGIIGGRTVWPRLSLDYGLAIPVIPEMDELIAIPWLGFVIPFGNAPKH